MLKACDESSQPFSPEIATQRPRKVFSKIKDILLMGSSSLRASWEARVPNQLLYTGVGLYEE